MNLSTARSAKRAKEIGLRKVAGASRKNIAGQFLGESMLFSLLALLPAFALTELLLPTFNALSGKELSLNIAGNLPLLSGLMGITLLTGIIASSYPALFLSSFQAVKVLKGDLTPGSKRSSFRKILVVVQFTLSIILTIGTAVVYTQLDYMKNKKLGYDKEQLLYIHIRGDLGRTYETLKRELMKYPGIAGVSGTIGIPSHIGNTSGGGDWDGKDPGQSVMVGYNYVDFDFIETMKIEMAEGRPFSREYSTDMSGAFIINEELVKLMGVEPAVGANFSFEGRSGKIIGVMKNFHHKSLREKIAPLVLMIEPDLIEFILIRLSPKSIPSSIKFLKTAWARFVPNYPLDYKFLDEDFDGMYRAEERTGTLSKYFSIIAIFIACFGLFGLASFTAEQRTKEIGIRKVLGASLAEIVWMLTREFAKLLLIANIIAWPVAYVAMSTWLQNFAYRMELSPWLFLVPGVIALIIALFTVSFQAIKTAMANPVNALKYE
jgi:ABC-type antimicrobial peptide transport system permease subunit